eukprot:scaffold38660_cov46-Phaeocystis_antarctica.AAC.3
MGRMLRLLMAISTSRVLGCAAPARTVAHTAARPPGPSSSRREPQLAGKASPSASRASRGGSAARSGSSTGGDAAHPAATAAAAEACEIDQMA